MPLSTPGLRAMTTASPISSRSTTALVVTSAPCSPRSSSSAIATTRSRSGFDETIGLLAQAECLLCEAEEIGALAAHAAFFSGRLDHAAVDDPAPGVAALDREPEHSFVDVLQL